MPRDIYGASSKNNMMDIDETFGSITSTTDIDLTTTASIHLTAGDIHLDASVLRMDTTAFEVNTPFYINGVEILTEIATLKADLSYVKNQKYRFPAVGLTASDTDLVVSSGEFNTSSQKWKAFNNIYGQGSATESTWVTGDTAVLSIDGSNVTGSYVYLNIGQTAIIKSFQIYAPFGQFPTQYSIIGSNDKATWASLYSTSSVSFTTDATNTVSNTPVIFVSNLTHFKYVGIVIVASEDSLRAIQELRLWGDEGPDVILEVRYPLVPLTSSDTNLVFASGFTTASFTSWHAFDGIYGVPADGSTASTWITQVRSALTIDSVSVTGAWIYTDLGVASPIITSFQFYCTIRGYPTSYQIIGSNNQTDWTSLYSESNTVPSVTIDTSDSFDLGYSLKISLSNHTSFKYVGMMIITNPQWSGSSDLQALQELLLWGY